MSTAAAVAARATSVARIFNAVAIFVLIVGAVLIGGNLLIGIFGGYGDSWLWSFVMGIVFAAVTAVYTAITWAGVTLATIVAGYIALRTEQMENPIR